MREGEFPYKEMGKLVVSRRNGKLPSAPGKPTPIFQPPGSRLGLHEKKKKEIGNLKCFKMASFRGKKKLEPFPDCSRGLIQISNKHPRQFHMGVLHPN